jgi:hypothetical protein
VLKASSPAWGYWEVVDPLKGEGKWQVFRSLKTALGEDCGTPASLSLSHSLLLFSGQQVSSSALPGAPHQKRESKEST